MECIFCKIANGEIPTEKVYEDDRIIAFKDVNPGAPVHILIIPKKHIPGLSALTEDDTALMGKIILIAAQLAKEMSVSESGFRIVANNGPDAGQSVGHIHFHLLGGRKLGWPPG